jgi:PAS domain S-box-containing protein
MEANLPEHQPEQLLQRLQQALALSERRFEAVVGSLSDPVTIRDRTHTLVYANRAALDHLGFSSVEELRHSSPDEIMADYSVWDQSGAEISMSQIPSVQILSGKPAAPLLIRTLHRQTGVQRWDLLKAAPLLDEHGEVEATIMVIEDVTEQQRAARNAEFLSHTSKVLASSLDYEQTLRNVAELSVPGLADWCAVDLADEDGNRQPVAVAHVDPDRLLLAEQLRQYEPEQLQRDRGLGLVFHTGEPLLYPEITDEMLFGVALDDRHLELLRAVGFRSALLVPMRIGTRTLGAMTLVSAESGRVLDHHDLDLASQIAARAAVAIENSRLYSERSRIAYTLQQSLLPDQLPEIPGYELAGLYAPARDGTEVGGDFYDVWPIADGWMITMGDVTGKGAEAAAMTSLARHTMRAVSEFVSSPAELLSHVDRTLKLQRPRGICTAVCIRLHGDAATIAVGGHPLPLRVGSDRVVGAGTHGPLLGGFEGATWQDTTVELEPGATLLVYTDGVTDAVGADGARYGIQRLLEMLATRSASSAEELVEWLTNELARFQTGPHADDTAVLVLRRLPAPSRLSAPGTALPSKQAIGTGN